MTIIPENNSENQEKVLDKNVSDQSKVDSIGLETSRKIIATQTNGESSLNDQDINSSQSYVHEGEIYQKLLNENRFKQLFTVLSELGSGGFATVYKVIDNRTKFITAVKKILLTGNISLVIIYRRSKIGKYS